MKKLLLACGLMGLVAAANAQPPGMPADGPPPHYKAAHSGDRWNPAAKAKHMQKTLQLSDEQTAKIQKILENCAQRRKTLDDKYKPQFEAFHADMEKLRKQARTEMDAVLTPKQKEALKAQRQMRERQRSHHDAGPMRGDRSPAK